MALVWITRIINGTDQQFDLLSNDDSKRPQVHGNTYMSDSPVPVPPYSDFRADNFVIPWRDHGRLLVRGPHGAILEVSVGPNDVDKHHDNVIVYRGVTAVMIYHADLIGPARHHHVTLRFEPGFGFGFGFQDRRAPSLFEYQNEIKLLALLLDPPEANDEGDEGDEEESEEDDA